MLFKPLCVLEDIVFKKHFLCRFEIYYMLRVEDLIAALYTIMTQYCSDLFRVPQLSQLQQ
jgi:hypothetical protein